MARRVRDSKLDSRSARAKLAQSGAPHWRGLGKGVAIGYRKGKRAGVWVTRRRIGGAYVVTTIAMADDVADADGRGILDFWQAQERAWIDAGRPAGPYTVADAVRDYLAERLEGKASYSDARINAARHILPKLGPMRVDALAASDIRRWHAGIETRSRSDRTRKVTANRQLGILKAALNFAFREGRVSSDTEWRRVKPHERVGAARTAWLTIEQCQRLLAACEPEFRLLVRAALETGCRYQELARLRGSDFHEGPGTIHIAQSKSGVGRHVVLTQEGCTFFAGLVAKGPEDPLPKLMLGRVWRTGDQTQPMRRACQAAGISPPVSFHILRHTWASLAVMAGIPLAVVARNLGHTSTRMTERHYGHLAQSYVSDTIRARAPRF
jgi:integrase